MNMDRISKLDLKNQEPKNLKRAIRNIRQNQLEEYLPELFEIYSEVSSDIKILIMLTLKRFPLKSTQDFFEIISKIEKSPKLLSTLTKSFPAENLSAADKEKIKSFLNGLIRNPNKKIIANCIEKFSELGMFEEISGVRSYLLDEDPRIRLVTSNALLKTRPSEMIDFLISQIGNAELQAILTELRNSKNTGYDEIENKLLSTLEKTDSPEAIVSIIEALATLNSQKSLPFLLKYINYGEDNIRLYSTQALGILGAPAAVPYLVPLLKDKNEFIRRKAADALAMITGKHYETYSAKLDCSEFLKNIAPFNQLPEKEFEALCEIVKIENYKKGSLVFELKDRPKKVFIVKAGVLKHYYPVGYRDKRVLSIYRVNDIFGDSHLLAQLPVYESIGEAETELQLCVIPALFFTEILKKHPDFWSFFYRNFTRQVTENFQSRRMEAKRSQLLFVAGNAENLYKESLVDELSVLLEKEIRIKPRAFTGQWLTETKEGDGKIFLKIARDLIEPFEDRVREFCKYENGVLSLFPHHLIRFFNIIQKEYPFTIISFGPKLTREHIKLLSFCDFIFYLLSSNKQEQEKINREIQILNSFVKDNFYKYLHKTHFGMVGANLDDVREVKSLEEEQDISISFILPKQSNVKRTMFVEGKLEVKTKASLPFITSLRRVVRQMAGRRMGMALSGNTARALCQIGILKTLHREGIEIDLLSGSSISGIIGACFALGMPLTDMESIAIEMCKKFPIEKIKSSSAIQDYSKYYLDFLNTNMAKIFGDLKFEDLKIPFFSQYFDMTTGENHIIERGSLVQGLLSTCALPLFNMKTSGLDGLKVDGALTKPIFSDILFKEGASYLLAVDLGARTNFAIEQNQSELDIFVATMEILQNQIVKNQILFADLIFEPELEDFSWKSFDRAQDIIAIGARACAEKLPRLLKLIANKKS
ncbi:HEAT repeat domain-containing protein [Candidatus Riflebacteria bacterium]